MAKKPKVTLKSNSCVLTIDDIDIGSVEFYTGGDPVVSFDDVYNLSLTDLKAIVEALENE